MPPVVPFTPTSANIKPKPHQPAVNITLQIDDEPVHEAPSKGLVVAFGLAFIPGLGLIGAILAAWNLFRSSRAQQPAHGLAYAALVIQMLYVILALTLVLVVFQLPYQNKSSLTDPSVQSGQQFLSAVQVGDTARLTNLIDNSYEVSINDLLPGYQSSIHYNPQSVSAEAIPVAHFQDSQLSGYNGRPASLQIWRVSTEQNTSHYFILTLGQDSAGAWRIVGILGLDAAGDQTARTVAQQIKTNSFTH